MAQLPDEDRARVWRGLMRRWSRLREALGAVSKSDLRAFVNYTDDWIDTNQAAYNAGMPEPAKSELTVAQKSLCFCAVTLARVSIVLLRQVFGEVE